MENWINTNINDEEKFLNEIREMFTINYINKNKLTSELNKSNKKNERSSRRVIENGKWNSIKKKGTTRSFYHHTHFVRSFYIS